MSDRIDTDAIREHHVDGASAHWTIVCEACGEAWPCQMTRLCDEVDALRAREVPDGHTVIDGKLFRLERHGDLNRYGLVRVRPEENPDV